MTERPAWLDDEVRTFFGALPAKHFWRRHERHRQGSEGESGIWHRVVASLALAIRKNIRAFEGLAKAVIERCEIDPTGAGAMTVPGTDFIDYGPEPFARFLAQRHESEVDVDGCDALCSHLLAIWVVERLEPAQRPDLEVLPQIRRVLDVVFARREIGLWRHLIWMVLTRSPYAYVEGVDDLWDQLRVIANQDERAALEIRRFVAELKAVPTSEDEAAAERAATFLQEREAELSALLTRTAAKEESAADRLHLLHFAECVQELAWRRLRMDRPDGQELLQKVAEIAEAIAPNEVDGQPEVVGWRPLHRAVLLDLQWTLTQSAPFGSQMQTVLARAQELRSDANDVFSDAWSKLEEAANSVLYDRFDAALNSALQAQHRFITARTIVGERVAATAVGRVHLAQARSGLLSPNAGHEVVPRLFAAVRQALYTGDDRLLTASRSVLSPAIRTSDVTEQIDELMPFVRDAQTRREKTIRARFAATFADFLSVGTTIELIGILAKQCADPWSLHYDVDVAGSSIAALGKIIPLTPGLCEPSEYLLQIVEGLRVAAAENNRPRVWTALASAITRIGELPDELRRVTAAPVLKLVRMHRPNLGQIDETEWSQLVFPVIRTARSSGDKNLVAKLEPLVPAFEPKLEGLVRPHVTDEVTLETRVQAGLTVDAEAVARYYSFKTREIESTYLQGQKFSYPGRFHAYLSAAAVSSPQIQGEAIERLLKVADHPALWPVIAQEALSAIRWLLDFQKRYEPERLDVFRALAPLPHEALLDQAKRWFGGDSSAPKSGWPQGDLVDSARAALSLLFGLAIADVRGPAGIETLADVFERLGEPPIVSSPEGREFRASIGAYALGRGGMDAENESRALADVLSHLASTSARYALGHPIGWFAVALARDDAKPSRAELGPLVRVITAAATTGPWDSQRSAARALGAIWPYRNAWPELRSEIEAAATSILNGPTSARAELFVSGRPTDLVGLSD